MKASSLNTYFGGKEGASVKMAMYKCCTSAGMSKNLVSKANFRLINSLCRGSENGCLLKNVTFPPSCYWRTVFYQHGRVNVKSWFSGIRLALITVTGMGIGGGVYGYLNAAPTRNNRISIFPHPQFDEKETDSEVIFPDVKISRSISGPVKSNGLSLTLFQYQNCPFCCKVRAFLDFYGLPYDIVEVNPVLRKQLKFSKYKKVPVVLAQIEENNSCQQLQDSTVIISTLGTYLLNPNQGIVDALKNYKPATYNDDEGKIVNEVMNRYFIMYGEQSVGKSYEDLKEERKWRRWVDNELVHVLSPNIYRTHKEALEAFNYFSDAGEWEKNFNKFERKFIIYVGATAMYFVGKRLKKRHNLKDNVRESLYDACRKWVKAVGNSKFMGGELPNLADLAVYGVLNSIEGCLAFQDVLHHTNIESWYKCMQQAIKNHEGAASLMKIS